MLMIHKPTRRRSRKLELLGGALQLTLAAYEPHRHFHSLILNYARNYKTFGVYVDTEHAHIKLHAGRYKLELERYKPKFILGWNHHSDSALKNVTWNIVSS